MILFKNMLFLIGISTIIGGCSAHKAPDFPKTWKPLNELPEQTNEIPLFKQHVYQVTQLDTTVKGLLERWAEEAKMPLVYDHSSDFTLFRKTKSVRNPDLKAALAELSSLYSEQDMVFYVQNEVIMAHKKVGVAVKTDAANRKKKSNKPN
ncbi:hypothetical protein [Neisseria sp. CCUG12390]|uniref:hypothetical protein n=1 Tax=Neisseria sp. CCUG12390 TaxID=3392035 RepID=UPI003A0FFD5C